MTEKNIKDIREVIKPHFGHLSMYKKWFSNGGINLKDIEEFHNYTKSHKNIIKQLGHPLNKYNSYYKVMLDIHKIERDAEVQRIFKNGLNGASRKFFKDTYTEHKKSYMRLMKNDFRMEVFFRNSSKPHNLEDYLTHLKQSLHFSNDMAKLVQTIEDNYDHLRTNSGAYLFKLNSDMLNIVPTSWCIYQNNSEYEREIRDRDLNSIWLIVDPCEKRNERTIVGIDISNSNNDLLYMNTLNNRFTDNVPIKSEEFFRITRSRLNSKPNSNDVDNAIAEYVKQREIERLKELETKEEKGTLTFLEKLMNSKYNL